MICPIHDANFEVNDIRIHGLWCRFTFHIEEKKLAAKLEYRLNLVVVVAEIGCSTFLSTSMQVHNTHSLSHTCLNYISEINACKDRFN